MPQIAYPADPTTARLEISVDQKIRAATELLEAVVENRAVLAEVSEEDRNRLLHAAGQVARPDGRNRKQLWKTKQRKRKAERLQREEALLSQTGIREMRRRPVFTTPNVYPPRELEQESLTESLRGPGSVDVRHCYICKRDYSEIHSFYDQLCPVCAELNFRKRTELADLRGRVALLSGGRVKIGYQAGLKLLRCGAGLIVTTRFPRDATTRYAAEPDFQDWGNRLEIFGLDLRHTPSVEAFCRQLLASHDRLNFIVNTGCQRVRRPPEFYAHMMEGEKAALPAKAQGVLGLQISDVL